MNVTCFIRQPANHASRKKGFTLVEMLLFLAIFTGLLVMLTSIFTASLDVQKESEATSAVQQDGSYIVSRLTYDITRATSITTPASLGSQTNTLVLVIGGITTTYALTNSNVTLTNNVGTDQLNSYDTTISNLTFKRLGNSGGKNSIQINCTVTSRVLRNNGYEVKNFQTTGGLR